ncbi:MAG: DNA-binding protein, partial [Thermoplasmata archaeon]
MKYSAGSFHVFRAPMGSELLSYIRDYAEKNHVKMGLVFAIGSIRNPKVGYFDEKSERYIT